MKTWICTLAVFVVVPAVKGELPHINAGENRGCFAIHESSRYDFQMKHTGEMTVIPKRRKLGPVAVANRIRIEYGIEELQPDGSAVFKKTLDGSLASTEKASDDFSRLTFQARTTGEAVYEVIIEQSRNVISLGGRVVDAGELDESHLRFALRIVVPNVYRNVQFKGDKDLRAYEKKTRSDYLRLVRIDGSRQNLDNDHVKAVDGPNLTGSGIEEIETRFSYYEGRRFFFKADKGSGMAISQGRSAGPWFEGFTVNWYTDTTTGPVGKSRLHLSVR
ncbi:MAG: hypothetical protein ACO3SO_10700 [Luteolibacter sp.]